MKKFKIIALLMVIMVGLSACGSSKTPKEVTAEEALNSLKEKITTITEVVIYDETTDPNESLGRPGNYIGKGNFFDERMENTDQNAGTIEVFSSKDDCDSRYDYLCKMSDSSLGVFGVNQYIYKYELAVYRIDFDFTPTQAAEFKTAMDEIMGEVSVQFKN